MSITVLDASSKIQAVEKYATALLNAEAKIAQLQEDAIQAFVSVTDYVTLKQLNKAFNDAYLKAAQLKGNDTTDKLIRDRCTASVQYIRTLAKKRGWKQPVNPNKQEGAIKPATDAKLATSKEVTTADGVITVKGEIQLSREQVQAMIASLNEHIPFAIWQMIADSKGLKTAFLNKAGSEGQLTAQQLQELQARLFEEVAKSI
ncbi:hypothetical protein V757_00360 [Pelistega indica]|uniref:Uncharacterized protein n=1 Tax=Pelistega indica TaxID=1414851 RepID=V8GBI4_9BURK|nr:tape measure protein [Pelistega indica]ETD73093.1 hypothetical protein V757_00360 [Pelistega indica]